MYGTVVLLHVSYRIAPRLSGFIAHMDDMLFAFGPSASEECASRGRRDYRTQYTLSLLEKIFREHGTLDYNMAESPDGA